MTKCQRLNESAGVIIELVLMYETVANPVLRESFSNKKLGTFGMLLTICKAIEKPFMFCWYFSSHVILPFIRISCYQSKL